jgi:hypothetical protein
LEALHRFVRRLEGEISSLSRADKVKISVDVDPEYMM